MLARLDAVGVPFGPVKQHTGEKSDEPITLLIHPGADGGGDLYEDDGDSFAYRRGDYSRFAFRWSDATRTLRVQQSHGPTAPRNWNGNLRALERNWCAISWQMQPGLRLAEMLINHLNALR